MGDLLPSAVLRIPDYLVPESPMKGRRRNPHCQKCPAPPTTALLSRSEPCSALSWEELEECRRALLAEMDLILEVKLWFLPEMAGRLKEISPREGELQLDEECQEGREDSSEATGDVQCQDNRLLPSLRCVSRISVRSPATSSSSLRTAPTTQSDSTLLLTSPHSRPAQSCWLVFSHAEFLCQALCLSAVAAISVVLLRDCCALACRLILISLDCSYHPVKSAKDGAEDHGSITTDFQEGANNRQDHRIHRQYKYSLMDYFKKYFLFLSNFIFTVLGLVVLGLGMWGLVTKESFALENIGSIGTDPMLILVTLGVLLTTLCLWGCIGAIRENCCLLKLFSTTVLVLIAVQVLAAILTYSLQDQIGGYMRSGMLAAMAHYQDDLDLRFITDEIQSNLQCCGADNYRDWEINIYYNCSSPGVLACGVPATCCVDPLENGTVWNSQCGVGAQLLDEFTAQSVIFLGGCLGAISRWIELHENMMLTVVIIIFGVQILALFFSTRLLETIKWHKIHM
ncbi:uncharacterized protein KZ484_003116 [Pholidichthys leucotaenia]